MPKAISSLITLQPFGSSSAPGFLMQRPPQPLDSILCVWSPFRDLMTQSQPRTKGLEPQLGVDPTSIPPPCFVLMPVTQGEPGTHETASCSSRWGPSDSLADLSILPPKAVLSSYIGLWIKGRRESENVPSPSL